LPLPGIFLSNVHSISNKLDKLQLLVSRNRDFSSSFVLCFTETWLCGSIPDLALQLGGFQLLRADCDAELSGKSKGGGICFYTNIGWCNDVTVILQHDLSSTADPFIPPESSPHSYWLVCTFHHVRTCRRRSAHSPTRYYVWRGLMT